MRQFALTLLLFLCPACGGTSGVPGGPPSLFVNESLGSDANPGTSDEPLQTIAMALSKASAGQTVQVEPGTYNVASGETFPLVIPAGVSLVGSPATQGGAPALTEIIADTPGVATVEVEQGAHVSGLHIVNVSGSAVRLSGDGASVTRCAPSAPIGVVVENALDVLVESNAIYGCKVGIHFKSGATGRVQENSLSSNAYAVVVNQAEPDLGGGTQGSTGGNEIHQSSLSDLLVDAPGEVVFAHNNCWDHSPPTFSTSLTQHADVLVLAGIVDSQGASACSGGI